MPPLLHGNGSTGKSGKPSFPAGGDSEPPRRGWRMHGEPVSCSRTKRGKLLLRLEASCVPVSGDGKTALAWLGPPRMALLLSVGTERKKPGGQARRRFLMDFPVSASVWRASGSAPAIRAARSRTIFWRMRSTRSRPSWVMATMILRRSLAALMRFR